MIPPFLATKAAELLAPVAATFASPLVKWGSIAGAVVLLVAFTNWKTYDYMRTQCEQSKLAALAEQAQEMAKQTVAASQMGSQVAKATEQSGRVIEQQATVIKRKVASHAKAKPAIPLSPEFVRLYDELRRVPNEAGHTLPADSGAGRPEVSRGEVRAPTPQLVQVDVADGESIELTTDELYQAVMDAYEKLAEVKNDYRGFSEWNDGRERIELERMHP